MTDSASASARERVMLGMMALYATLSGVEPGVDRELREELSQSKPRGAVEHVVPDDEWTMADVRCFDGTSGIGGRSEEVGDRFEGGVFHGLKEKKRARAGEAGGEVSFAAMV